jgi:hypothetical protein
METAPKLLKTDHARIWRSKKMENRDILNFATWNMQGISYNEDQLDEILAKKT